MKESGSRPSGRDPGARSWWLAVVIAGSGLAWLQVLGDEAGRLTVRVLSRGLLVTLRVTLFGFAIALLLGLLLGIARVSKRHLLRELATLYVEVIRGFPMLVLLLWIGFGLVPPAFALVMEGVAWLDARQIEMLGLTARLLESCRRPSDCVSLELRGIIGLGIGYGAYVAEVVRAGIQSIASGQVEAAYSLGMSRGQAMRHVILPQALRLSLPPLGNDLIAMLKDSALISVLAVRDLVYVASTHIAQTFQALEVWNAVALLYLMMTLPLSLAVRWLERRGGWPGAGA